MKNMQKLGFEIYKNFKLIFRNWSSLLLIVLAPLILILLVGYSLSGDKIHDIKIGIIADKSINLAEFENNVSSFAQIINYKDPKVCIGDLSINAIHICLEIKGSLAAKKGEIPTGEVKFYYDNTREKISLLLLTKIKDYFGLTSERISLISTQQIFDNLQSLLSFINQRIDDIDKIKAESEKIRTDLIQRKEKLTQTRDNFEPKYLLIKSIQEEMHLALESFNNASTSLLSSITILRNSTTEVRTLLNSTLPSDSNLTLAFNLLDFSIMQLEKNVDNVENKANMNIIEVNRIANSVDDMVVQLDDINTLLNEEINRTDDYLVLINQSVEQIDAIATQAKDKMKDLSKLDPSLASKLVKPITQSFSALVQDVKDIQLAFPLLLSTIIIFISLLFSNIITLLELTNKAYTRNILAPVNDIVYTAGIAITSSIIIFVQVIVLLIVAQTQFLVNILPNLWSIIPVVLLLILTFVFIGMIIAYLSKNIQTSILLSTFIALIFFLFSDSMNALEAMPQLASEIAAFNPIVIANSIFRNIFFFGIKLEQMPVHIGFLAFYAIVAATALIIISKKKNKQRL
jgi:ABC-type multidrug transport system permease subunit